MELIKPSQTFNSLVGYNGSLYNWPLADLKCAYAIDLSRLPLDIVGSTNKAHTSIIGSVTIKTDDFASTLLTSVELTPAAHPITNAVLNYFDFYVYIEKTTPVHLTRGMYR
jgi:hypothetical protein